MPASGLVQRMTISAGGETWRQSDHVQDPATKHPEVLDYHLAYVLDNWTLAGDRFSKTHQRWQRHYMAIVPDDPEEGHMVGSSLRRWNPRASSASASSQPSEIARVESTGASAT